MASAAAAERAEERIYRRVLLKLSGEAFGEQGLDPSALDYVVGELRAARELSVELAVVVGGGNLIRGRDLLRLDRAVADQMGMLATVINGLALQEALRGQNVSAVLQSAVAVPWADSIRPQEAREALSQQKIVIFAGGTGNPFVTTDTAAAIRAAEIGADALLKATNVDGVYTADPKRDPAAKKLQAITVQQAIRERLGVMDLAALALCEEHNIPIVVFDFFKEGNLKRVLRGERIGTQVSAR
jgi:uridylate kinase